jgi:crotonobetainyl-CoA:carnitine CoA-transferase CaiB-like acyl-CoA transferase
LGWCGFLVFFSPSPLPPPPPPPPPPPATRERTTPVPPTPPKLPLEGVRVLDVGTLIAGPFGPTLLGDFGAEVIKVEQPGTGDPIRTSSVQQFEGVPLHWLSHGRNKLSVTLNLRAPEGQAILRRLIEVSDILVENFTPGTLDGWGFSWEAVHALNPRLIMVRVSGFGQTGPYSRRPGYDRIALGFSGFLYTTGYADRAPVRPSYATADFTTGIFNALAALLALYWRDAQGGGEGQLIDLALYEALFRITEDTVPAYDKLGVVRERMGNRNPGFTPGDNFLTADGTWIMIAAGGDNVFARLARVMGREDLLADERFATARGRNLNADLVCAEVQRWVERHPYEEVAALLEEAGVPAGGVYSVREIMEDPHYAAREGIVEVEHPRAGRVKMPAVLPKLGTTPGAVRWPGPELGAHNAAIYEGLLGMDADMLSVLRGEGVI